MYRPLIDSTTETKFSVTNVDPSAVRTEHCYSYTEHTIILGYDTLGFNKNTE